MTTAMDDHWDQLLHHYHETNAWRCKGCGSTYEPFEEEPGDPNAAGIECMGCGRVDWRPW